MTVVSPAYLEQLAHLESDDLFPDCAVTDYHVFRSATDCPRKATWIVWYHCPICEECVACTCARHLDRILENKIRCEKCKLMVKHIKSTPI